MKRPTPRQQEIFLGIMAREDRPMDGKEILARYHEETGPGDPPDLLYHLIRDKLVKNVVSSVMLSKFVITKKGLKALND